MVYQRYQIHFHDYDLYFFVYSYFFLFVVDDVVCFYMKLFHYQIYFFVFLVILYYQQYTKIHLLNFHIEQQKMIKWHFVIRYQYHNHHYRSHSDHLFVNNKTQRKHQQQNYF